MINIKIEIKNKNGKSINRQLRLNNKCPAVIYGKNKKPISITIQYNFFMNIKNKNTFYKQPINLICNENIIQVIIKSVQRHPINSKIIHIDFLRNEY
ncbi:MAG: 50S ribosomal protein L25 [Enterobacterales bacterium]